MGAHHKKSFGKALYLHKHHIGEGEIEKRRYMLRMDLRFLGYGYILLRRRPLREFQIGVCIGEGVAVKFSDIEYGKIAILRMEEKVLIFDGENFKSDGVRIVEHLKKENVSEYRFIPLTDTAIEIIKKAREINPNGVATISTFN